MDNRKKGVIERYIRAVSYHGPKLVNLTKEEQGDGADSVMGFVFPYSKDVTAATYFRNRLQASSPGTSSTASWEDYRSSQPETTSNAVISTTQIEDRLCQFIATKADLLFEMQGKTQIQQSVNCGVATSQEALRLYANPPPVETLMAVPVPLRRKELFRILKVGSIVLGKVTSKRPFGIFVKLTMLEFSKTRDFTGLHVEALCRIADLGGSAVAREYKDPTDAFVVGDRVRGVISVLDAVEERVSLSFRTSRLPPGYESLELGVIDETPESDAKRTTHFDEDMSYEDCLKTDVGFNNPRSVDTLLDELGIDEKAPCSLLRRFHRSSYPEGDFAEALRKRQSAKWSMETTAKGVEHFKAGHHDAADKYFEHALQIDSENVEALVARGALAANRGQLSAAVRDFRRALSISGTHRNAHKYLTATLVEQGIQLEKEGELEEALECFKEALGFDRDQAAAREHLEKVQQLIAEQDQKKERDAAKKEENNKSKFRHVRQLIKAEQSQAKKKNMLRKKKKKQKSQRKKKIKSKSHRRSRRSSSSQEFSDSSDTSSRSSAGEPRVEKPGTRRKSSQREDSGGKRGTNGRRTSESAGKSEPLQQSDNEGPGVGGRGSQQESGFVKTRGGGVHSFTGGVDTIGISAEKRTARKRRTRSPSSGSSSDSTSSSGYSNKRGNNLARKSRRKRQPSRSSDSCSGHGDKRARARSRSAISRESSSDHRYSKSKETKGFSHKSRRERARSRSYSVSSNSSADQKNSRHRTMSRRSQDRRKTSS